MSRRMPPFTGAAFDVVVLAASAGGLNALSQVLSQLPAGFPAALLAVQHLAPHHRSLMPQILAQRTALQVREAEAGDVVVPGQLYIAPPDRHLLINPDMTLLLAETELVHFVRPSADLLFESAAACCHERTLGVVVSGSGSDGNMGVRAIRAVGGVVLVQDPATAEFPGMPEAALATGCVDYVLPLAELGPALRRLVAAG